MVNGQQGMKHLLLWQRTLMHAHVGPGLVPPSPQNPTALVGCRNTQLFNACQKISALEDEENQWPPHLPASAQTGREATKKIPEGTQKWPAGAVSIFP